MKRILLPLWLCLAACHSTDSPVKKKHSNVLPAGSIVVADSTRIVEDKLNEQYFSVTLYATDSSINGSYDIEAYWGYNLATSTIRMPYGGEHYRPLLRKGPAPYTYIIGFNFDDDTLFHDYYGISAQRGQIAMKYLKAYTTQ